MSNRKVKRAPHAFKFILFFLGLCLVAMWISQPNDLPLGVLFFGRLHPLFLHFPIVLIFVCLLLEAIRIFRSTLINDGLVFVLLALAALSSAGAAIAGHLLYASGDYSGALAEQHRWTGTVTGLLALATAGLFAMYYQKGDKLRFRIYLATLLFSNLAVIASSHYGGSITHGPDYLTEHLQLIINSSDDNEKKPESEMLLYQDVIHPVFESKCVSCHNSIKAKGDFLMTSYSHLAGGGKSGLPGITEGNTEKSEVYNRVSLPDDHDDKMPPPGQTPLTPVEIDVLKWWIANGASQSQRIDDVEADTAITALLQTLLPEIQKYKRKIALQAIKTKELESELQSVAQTLGLNIFRDSLSDERFYSLSMSIPPQRLTRDDLRMLQPYFEVFSSASFVSSSINDDALYFIGQMKNLEKLFLQKTAIKGSGIAYLKQLPKLKQLNLSFTSVDDKSALDLLKIPALEEVYLYRTNASEQVIEAIRQNRKSMVIHLTEGPYF